GSRKARWKRVGSWEEIQGWEGTFRIPSPTRPSRHGESAAITAVHDLHQAAGLGKGPALAHHGVKPPLPEIRVKSFRSRLALFAGCAVSLVLALLLGSSLAVALPGPPAHGATMAIPF